MFDFFAAHFWQILAAVLSLGGVGIVIAIAAFGIPAALFLDGAVRAFKATLQFLSTPFGQAVAIILAIIVSIWIGYAWCAGGEAERWKARLAELYQEQQERESTIRAEVKKDADSRIEKLDAAESELSKKEIENERTFPADDKLCFPTDDDFRRLRALGLE